MLEFNRVHGCTTNWNHTAHTQITIFPFTCRKGTKSPSLMNGSWKSLCSNQLNHLTTCRIFQLISDYHRGMLLNVVMLQKMWDTSISGNFDEDNDTTSDFGFTGSCGLVKSIHCRYINIDTRCYILDTRY